MIFPVLRFIAKDAGRSADERLWFGYGLHSVDPIVPAFEKCNAGQVRLFSHLPIKSIPLVMVLDTLQVQSALRHNADVY
eukprot:scaffold24065_cov137-Cylindrotheca_fusiformis.AAC.1